MNDDISLVVAGAGGGLAGALRAAQLGLDTVVVEASEHFRRGNNTSMSTAMIPGAGSRFQSAVGIEDSPARFVADMEAKTRGQVDLRLAWALASVSAPLVEWLAAHVGLPIELPTDFRYPGHSVDRMHSVPQRHGNALVDHLSREAGRHELIEMMIPARLIEINSGSDGICGAVVERPDGTREELPTAHLLLATNGYGANRELVRRYLPEIAEAVYHGSEYSTGDALAMGEALGADTAFLDAYQGHAALAGGAGTLVGWATMMHGGIMVDQTGRRFGDETCGYSEYAAMLAARPGASGWIIIDERIFAACMPFTDFAQTVESGMVLKADSMDELIRLTGLPAQPLRTEMDAAVRAAAGERDEYGRTNWEQPLAAPYRAVQVVPALFHTQGGLMVDEHARVLRPGGTPIKGLYAAGGAAMGISGHGAGGYLAGNGLLPAFGLGYLAAEHVAAESSSATETR